MHGDYRYQEFCERFIEPSYHDWMAFLFDKKLRNAMGFFPRHCTLSSLILNFNSLEVPLIETRSSELFVIQKERENS